MPTANDAWADPAPRAANTAKALSIAPAYAPNLLVLSEDVALLGQTDTGRRILAAATAADANGALVPADAAASHGTTGLKVQAGRVHQEYNSDLYDLVARMNTYDEMRRSETAVGSMEMLISLPIAQTEFYVIPGDDKQLSDLLEWNLFERLMQPTNGIPGRPFSRVMREASLAPLMGFAWHYQKVGTIDAGSMGSFVGWQEIAPRLQSTVHQWDFDDEGHVLGLVQYGTNPRTSTPQYVYYRRDEMILWSWIDDGGDPEGLGALRRAYRAYKQKDDFQDYAAIRIERQACGIPIAIAPDGVLLTSPEATAVVDFMRAVRTGHDSGGAVPYGWEIKMLELGDASVPFESHIERQHQAILQTTGAQMVGFGQGGDPGSNALIKGAGDWFGEVLLEAVADWACDTFNCEAIPDFAKRNGSTASKLPRLGHGKVAVRNVEAYTRAMERMYRDNGGLRPDAQKTWKDMMGITPTVDDGDELMKPTEEPAAGGEGGDGGEPAAAAPAQGEQVDESGAVPKKKGGDANGSRRGKLTEDQVRQIRNDKGATAAELARKFGVDESTILRVRNGLTWKSVQ